MPAPILKIGTTSQYGPALTSYGANNVFQPLPATGYSIIGYYSSWSGTRVPVVTLAVANDDPANPLLKNPVDYSLILQDPAPNVIYGDSAPSVTFGVWQPIAPPNYVALGQVCVAIPYGSSNNVPKPDINAIVCLRSDYTAQIDAGPVRWTAKDAVGNTFQVYQVDKTNVMYLQLGDGTPQPVFIPKQLLAAEAPTEDAGSTEDTSSM